MLLSDFDYTLPPHLIASEPQEPRVGARMLDLRDASIVDRIVSDFPLCLEDGDVLVVNNTKVLPARLLGRRGEAKIEVTLHRRLGGASWLGFARPAKKLKLGDEVVFSSTLKAEINHIGEGGERGFLFNKEGAMLDTALEESGTMPLPPYIHRPNGAKDADKHNYQTMFAKHKGAVAAPTAGLHFTPELLTAIKERGVNIAEVTLHVGAGTFLPVKHEDISKHVMHKEWGSIDKRAANMINTARANGGKVIAVGTTVLRLLESCFMTHGDVREYTDETDLFILPGFKFGVVDLLLTNFHLPKSTLLMLVAAFVGKMKIDQAYAHAIASNYRFFSYGDCCLMERNDG